MARRYFLDPLPDPGQAVLRDEIAHHLGTVLRCARGDLLTLSDGRGTECSASVQAVSRGEITVALGPHRLVEPPPLQVHLALAPPRWQRAEWLFEHATELGVAVFHPLFTERTRPQAERQERWQKLCLAAAGQCDRAHIPRVHPPRSLAEFLGDPELPTTRLLAAQGGNAVPAMTAGAVVLLVGPEGGFAPSEDVVIAAAGFTPVHLGPHVLRTETAALVGAGLLLHGTQRPAFNPGSPA